MRRPLIGLTLCGLAQGEVEMLVETPLQKAIREGTQPGGQLLLALSEFMDGREIDDPADARALVEALRHVPRHERGLFAPWSLLLTLMQQVRAKPAADVVRAEAGPLIADRVRSSLAGDLTEDEAEEVFLALKVLAIHSLPQAVELVEHAARKPVTPGSFHWAILLETFSGTHRDGPELIRRLADPLPEGFIAAAVLKAANALARRGRLERHPFDHPEGYRVLESILLSRDRMVTADAPSAARALAFVAPAARDRLRALAEAHPDPKVREAASTADGAA